MCGIVGLVSAGSVRDRVDAIDRALARIRHRGPDDRGIECVPCDDHAAAGLSAILGNARLAILDLTPHGHMPMASPDGRVWLTYNGEVYNFRELRTELEQLGHVFRSTGDTEVILSAYIQWGDGFLARLNGMFAIAIFDHRTSARFLLARDQVGIKPCYYSWRGGELSFASEIKALLAAGPLDTEIDWQAVADYFTYLFIPGPRTAFVGVRQLPPGHYLVWEAGRPEPRVDRYWSPLPKRGQPAEDLTIEETASEFRDLLRDAVGRQLIADVPLGIFLSGGIDSAIMTGLAAEHVPGRLKTFTIVFEGEGISWLDDKEHARRVSQRFDTEHHEITVGITDPAEMIGLAAMFDQPFANPTYYLAYLVSRETRREVTVALSGAGGDELFGGYPRYRALPYAGLLGAAPRPLAAAVNVVAGLWREDPEDPLPRRAKLLLRGLGERFPEQYVRWTYFFSDTEKRRLLAPLYAQQRNILPATRVIDGLLGDALQMRDVGNRVQYADLATFLADNILEYTDRTSMAVSLEVRVPYLDVRIVERSFATPFAFKLQGNESKRLLLKAFGDLIPAENAAAPKRGFSPPIAIWMTSALDRYFERELTRERVERIGLMSWPQIQRLRDEHRRRLRDNSMQLFGIIIFDAWWRRHFDDDA